MELVCVKLSPIVISFLYLLNTILDYFDVRSDILDYLAGTSLLTCLPMYMSSLVYKFCKYHRMMIHYIVICNIVSILDYYIHIPLSDGNFFALFLIIAGIFLFLTIYYRIKYGDRKVALPACFASAKNCEGHRSGKL